MIYGLQKLQDMKQQYCECIKSNHIDLAKVYLMQLQDCESYLFRHGLDINFTL
jgi:hypothetical protein